MSKEDLIPVTQRSKEEAKRISSKGGKRSGEVRRQKADLRKAAQALLDATFTDKNGNSKTGQEIAISSIIANASDPKSRNWGKAMDLLVSLTGANVSKEDKAKAKAETKLLNAKINSLSGADTTALDKLDDILTEMKNNADSNTKTE